jgi:hypothetical protein
LKNQQLLCPSDRCGTERLTRIHRIDRIDRNFQE